MAAAFERAQEAQERTIREQMSALGNRIMQTPLGPEDDEYKWCDEFLGELIRLLSASGAHIRLLSGASPRKQEYRLVSAVGHLAELRFRTRPVTRSTHGGCNLRLLMKGDRITNSPEETARLNRNVRAVAHEAQYGDLFLRGLRRIGSTAMFPLKHGEEILGSFVVEGLESYLFTERNARIVHAAAELAGAILCRKNADRDLLQFDRERTLMFETLVSATEGTADQRLRKAIGHLCSALEADVASVFVWHDTVQKLVLHTAHNWYEPMEGKASYSLGEGWTGSIATGKDHLSLVCPGVPGGRIGKRRYYTEMVPPAQRSPEGKREPRVGVRLMAGDQLVGVVTFAYYREHAARLRSDHDRKLKLLEVLRHLITLSVEAATHGDPNPRNCLVHPDDPLDMQWIDCGDYRPDGRLVSDLAIVERDIKLVLLGTEKEADGFFDLDVRQIPDWCPAERDSIQKGITYKPGHAPGSAQNPSPVYRAYRLVGLVRERAQELDPDGTHYFAALLYWTLDALKYEAVRPTKKLLALYSASEILRKF